MHDVLVVGLGAVGSAALYHLAQRGCRVVGVDAHAPPHAIGSTHGRSRIIREAYYEHPSYVPLVRRAFENWNALEELAGVELYRQTGGLMIGAEESALIRGTLASASLHALAVECVSPREIAGRFPAFAAPADMVGVYERRAGVLFPEACVRAYLRAAQEAGAEIRTNTRVLDLVRKADAVTAETHDGCITAKRVVIAAGPWANTLLKMLGVEAPLVVERQTMHWFEPSALGRSLTPEQFPVALMEHAADRFCYAVPDVGDGVKAAIHHEGAFVSPDALDREITSADTDPVRALARRFIPAAADTIRASATCMYTDTPDQHFIVDTVHGMANVVLASACSGHGFKFASALGEVVAQLALEQQPAVDISFFGWGRFA